MRDGYGGGEVVPSRAVYLVEDVVAAGAALFGFDFFGGHCVCELSILCFEAGRYEVVKNNILSFHMGWRCASESPSQPRFLCRYPIWAGIGNTMYMTNKLHIM